MIAHYAYKRMEEAEKELEKVQLDIQNCWKLGEYEYLKVKRDRLKGVISLNKAIWVKSIATVRHTPIKGFDNRCGQTNNVVR